MYNGLRISSDFNQLIIINTEKEYGSFESLFGHLKYISFIYRTSKIIKMVNKTYIEYFADLFTLHRNLTRIILEYEGTKKIESIGNAYKLHLNEMESMDLRLDLLYKHAKKLSALNFNDNCHHQTLHLGTTNFRKNFKLFKKIEEEN